MEDQHEPRNGTNSRAIGGATAEHRPQSTTERETATTDQNATSEQAGISIQDIDVEAAENAEVVNDPRMKTLCDMHNEVHRVSPFQTLSIANILWQMMSTMSALTYQPQLYPKAQHMASVLYGNEDLPTVIRVHALMVLGLEEKKKEGAPTGKEAMREAIGLVKRAVEAGEVEREGAEGLVGVCLSNMDVEGVPEWARLGGVAGKGERRVEGDSGSGGFKVSW